MLVVLALSILTSAPVGAEDWTYCNIGTGAQGERNYDLAIKYYTLCLNEGDLSRSSQVKVYNERGTVYRQIGAFDRAIADFDRALHLDPAYANAYVNRGNAYSDKGANYRAIADYTQALRINPDFAIAYNNRGNAYFDMGPRQSSPRSSIQKTCGR